MALNDGVQGFPTVLKKYKDGRVVKFSKDRNVANLLNFTKQ